MSEYANAVAVMVTQAEETRAKLERITARLVAMTKERDLDAKVEELTTERATDSAVKC